MPKTVAFVACVGKKNSTPMPARDLYTSAWFRKASAYATRTAGEWYILSAKYGLVSPDEVIKPYDETLNRMPAAARRAWAKRVMDDLTQRLEPGDEVIILAGQRYRADLLDPLRQMGCTVQIPMQGLRIGEQLAWLNRQLGG
jgi:cytoplasmic iron level regulating protein YaaA (DUF328/UPF0246 family)